MPSLQSGARDGLHRGLKDARREQPAFLRTGASMEPDRFKHLPAWDGLALRTIIESVPAENASECGPIARP